MAIVGIGILATAVGSFLQPLFSRSVGYYGYVIGMVGVGVMAVGFIMLLIQLAFELIKNAEFAPYRL